MEVEREAEHLGGDHRHRRIRTLSHVHRAAGHRATSPGVQRDHRDRRRGCDARFEADRKAAPSADRPAAAIERLFPVHERGEPLQNQFERGIAHQRACCLWSALAQQVLPTQGQRIHADGPRDHVGVALVCPDELRHAKPAQRACRRQVGVDLVGIDPDVLDVVRAGGGETRFLCDPRPNLGVGAAVPPDLAGTSRDAPVARDAALDPQRGCVFGDRVELLLHRERDLHRPVDDQGRRRDERFELDVELCAEAAAQVTDLHAHPVLRPAEQARDLAPDERGRLRRGVDRHASIAWLGHRHWGFERQVEHLLHRERMFEDVVGCREGCLYVSAPQLEVEGHVGVAPALQVFEIGKESGRFQHVVHDDRRGHRFDLSEHRGPFLVVDLDEPGGLLGDVWIRGEHQGHRLPDVAHLLDGEHRLVVERRAVMRIDHDGGHVLGGQHAMHSRQGQGRLRIDPSDTTVREGAAHDFPVQHARQPEGVDVLGPPRQLGPGFESGDGVPDVAAAIRLAGHQEGPSAMHWRMPRPIDTRTR